MEKVYQLMDLLDIHQSVDWLQSMTGKPLKESDLLKLCNAKHCNIYLVFRDEKIKDSTVFKRELYDLAAKVSSPVLWLTGDDGELYISGKCTVESNSWYWEHNEIDFPDCDFGGKYFVYGNRVPFFKPKEIQALAAKILGDLPPSSNTINSAKKGLHSESEKLSEAAIYFPYSTKQLMAMRDAAVKFWQHHDRSKPAPYGVQKQIQSFLMERTGDNARKVAELAAAIKPDDLPKG